MKQVIVMRRDLKMRRGKECAQAGHAALKWLADCLNPSVDDLAGRFLTEEQAEWLYGTQKKVVVYVNSEQELLDLHAKAKDTGLESHLIQDLGLTEFGGNPTYTCLAIGPNSDTQIDQVIWPQTTFRNMVKRSCLWNTAPFRSSTIQSPRN